MSCSISRQFLSGNAHRMQTTKIAVDSKKEAAKKKKKWMPGSGVRGKETAKGKRETEESMSRSLHDGQTDEQTKYLKR